MLSLSIFPVLYVTSVTYFIVGSLYFSIPFTIFPHSPHTPKIPNFKWRQGPPLDLRDLPHIPHPIPAQLNEKILGMLAHREEGSCRVWTWRCWGSCPDLVLKVLPSHCWSWTAWGVSPLRRDDIPLVMVSWGSIHKTVPGTMRGKLLKTRHWSELQLSGEETSPSSDREKKQNGKKSVSSPFSSLQKPNHSN